MTPTPAEGSTDTAAAVLADLEAARTAAALASNSQRLGADEEVVGVRMGTLFALAKRHTDLPLGEVETLLAEDAYEARLAALCILDFKARRRRVDDAEREALAQIYLRHHDRITSWDMVDRSAPRVVGLWLVGRDKAVLHELAGSPDPLRRRTAMTAPLGFLDRPDVDAGWAIAAVLAADPDPLVHKPVGIFAKHAGKRDQDRLVAFMDAHVAEMARPAVRLAVEKLPPDLRSRWV